MVNLIDEYIWKQCMYGTKTDVNSDPVNQTSQKERIKHRIMIIIALFHIRDPKQSHTESDTGSVTDLHKDEGEKGTENVHSRG